MSSFTDGPTRGPDRRDAALAPGSRGRRVRAPHVVPATATAAVAVIVAVLTTGDLRAEQQRSPTGAGEPAVTVNPTPTFRSTPVATATSNAVAASTAMSAPTPPGPAAPSRLPALTPGMPLPKNQRYADFVPVSSDMRLKGAAIGLGRFHSQGEPVHLILVPGRSLPGVFPDGTREGMCVISLSANASLNAPRMQDGREYSCTFLPRAGSKKPEHVGGGATNNPPSTIDEFRDVQWPYLTASSETATVEFRQGDDTTRLTHRITHPDLEGVVFIGIMPNVPILDPGRVVFVGRDASGRELFRR